MSVAEPQRNLGAQASPSRTRSPDPKVVAQSLVDDARTATPPPTTDERGRLRRRLQTQGRRLRRVLMMQQQEVL
jgi:hypothetical protein